MSNFIIFFIYITFLSIIIILVWCLFFSFGVLAIWPFSRFIVIIWTSVLSYNCLLLRFFSWMWKLQSLLMSSSSLCCNEFLILLFTFEKGEQLIRRRRYTWNTRSRTVINRLRPYRQWAETFLEFSFVHHSIDKLCVIEQSSI